MARIAIHVHTCEISVKYKTALSSTVTVPIYGRSMMQKLLATNLNILAEFIEER